MASAFIHVVLHRRLHDRVCLLRTPDVCHPQGHLEHPTTRQSFQILPMAGADSSDGRSCLRLVERPGALAAGVEQHRCRRRMAGPAKGRGGETCAHAIYSGREIRKAHACGQLGLNAMAMNTLPSSRPRTKARSWRWCRQLVIHEVHRLGSPPELTNQQ